MCPLTPSLSPSDGERIPRTVGSRFVPLNPSPALKGTLSPSEGERDEVRGLSVAPRLMGRVPFRVGEG
jgi:hypothetical protein